MSRSVSAPARTLHSTPTRRTLRRRAQCAVEEPSGRRSSPSALAARVLERQQPRGERNRDDIDAASTSAPKSADVPARLDAAPQPGAGARFAQQLPRRAVPAGARRAAQGRPGRSPSASTTGTARSPEQFPLGIRQIELDVWSDPKGGKYAHPSLPQSLGLPPPDPAVMDKPGFKVIHEADIDTNSTCLTFVLCLRAGEDVVGRAPGPRADHDRRRDEGHRGDAGDVRRARRRDPLGALTVGAHHPRRRARLRPEPRSRDPHAWVADARRGARPHHVHARQRELRAGRARRAIRRCGAGSCSRRRRPATTTPRSAKLNDPIADAAKIKAALAANMLVRTRADADTVQARSNEHDDARRRARRRRPVREHRLRGARPALRPYVVQIPGGTPARCNPVTAPPTCRPTDVENPKWLTASPRGPMLARVNDVLHARTTGQSRGRSSSAGDSNHRGRGHARIGRVLPVSGRTSIGWS